MTTNRTTMRAIVLEAPGPPEALRITEIPIPTPRPGEVLIKVEAFGLNRSERHTRLGLADGVTFPRVLGIEATGTVSACPDGEHEVGQQVAALMGGMGRTFDGGYAEYTCVPVRQTVPFESSLDWAILGAVPEMLQTSYGSLTIGLDAKLGQSLLIRGGTSSIGMATTVLAKRLGMTVLSTTRHPERADTLRGIGVDHVLVDEEDVATRARRLFPEGVDARSNSSGPRRYPTPCGRHGSTGSCASPGCCPTSGPFATSTRSSTSRAASGSPPTAETPPTFPPRCCRTSSSRSRRVTPTCRSTASTALTTSPAHPPTWKPGARPTNSSSGRDTGDAGARAHHRGARIFGLGFEFGWATATPLRPKEIR